MPELPEVQTTVNGMNRSIIGLKVTGIWTDWKKAFKSSSFKKFIQSASAILTSNKEYLFAISDGI